MHTLNTQHRLKQRTNNRMVAIALGYAMMLSVALFCAMPQSSWAKNGTKDGIKNETTYKVPLQERLRGPGEAETVFAFTERLEEVEEAADNAQDATLVLTWQIAPYYYLYDDKVQILDAEGTPLAITAAKDGAPLTHNDPLFGEVIVYRDQLVWAINTADLQNAASITYQGCWDGGICYPPQTVALTNDIQANNTPWWYPLTSDNHHTFNAFLSERSLIIAALLFYAVGVLLAFTPCVLPTIPLVAGIITNQTNNAGSQKPRRAVWLTLTFVGASSLVYAALGLAAGLFGHNLQVLLQQGWITLLSTMFMLAFALALFGAYTLQVPPRMQNALHRLSHRTSSQPRANAFYGSALLGAFSALIIGPCLAPPLAGILVFLGNYGSPTVGAIALLALGFGMGTPLMLFATSLNHLLPKAGAWMESVQHGFGFLLLVVAVYLADRSLPDHWALGLYGLILLAASGYVWVRAGVLTTLWASVLARTASGIFIIAAMAQIAGFMLKSPYATDPLYPLHNGSQRAQAPSGNINDTANTITSLAELNRTLADKPAPAMLIFTADWCIICKTLERTVLADPTITTALANITVITADVTKADNAALALLAYFDITGPPAFLFYDRTGDLQPQHTALGDITVARLANILATL